MKDKETFTLIDGTFDPLGALNLISVLFSTKIEYHNRNILNAHEQTGSDLPLEEKRVTELENTRQAFQQRMREAAKEGYKVEIKSTLEVNFVIDNT